MTKKVQSGPVANELWQPDYRERAEALFTGPSEAPSGKAQKKVPVGWRYVWASGHIYDIRVYGDDQFEILLQGYEDYERTDKGQVQRCFRFQMPQDDFLADARRSQSDGLGFGFGCYLTGPKKASRKAPLLVQQIKYHAVWGRPEIYARLGYQVVKVDVTNELLSVKVKT